MNAGSLIREAVAVYRAHAGLVIRSALLVFGLAAVADTMGDLLIERAIEGRMAEVVITILAGPVSLSSAALVLFAGMLDRLVGHHLHGHQRPTIAHTLRTLPWGRLLVADVLLIASVSAGLLLGIIPGLAIFTFLGLIGPVINIENTGVIPSFRRTAQLVRGHFWLVFVLVTIPVALESALLHGFHFIGEERPLLAAFIVSGFLGVVAGASIGLIEVVLTHALIQNKPGDS